MERVAFESADDGAEIIAWVPGDFVEGAFEFTGKVSLDDPRWYIFFYKFPDFMREGWTEPTYVPPEDQSVQMPQIKSEDIPIAKVN
ncbi:TPA: hypothetical protein ACQ31I_002665 [Yersinia enterocolitica]